ncbi:MAG: hypothetical protein FD138_2071, partial [Planctomycetota bacterium]
LCLLIPLFCWEGIAQEQSPSNSASEAAEQIKAARANTALFKIQDAESGAEIERVENPVLRYAEQSRGNTRGTVWLWGRKGRPAAVLEMIRNERQDWFCFHATADRPIKLTAKTGQTWTPKSSDLNFKPLPDAPPPADSSAARMRQMKEFVRKFSAHEFWQNARHEMRLLPAAVHRYDDPDRKLIDGAIFVIALGTHPEATLFLEAAHPADERKPLWQFAVGRSGAAEIVVSYDDKEVHHAPLIETLPPPTNSYWRMILNVEAKGGQP